MKNGLFKKSMSVFLAVLMLLSSWVFVPGEHHLHAEAASESATAVINKAALGEINTSFDTSMTTTTNNKYKPVENGKNGDTSGCSTEEFNKSYQNVLNFNNGAVVSRSLGSAVTFTDVPRADSIKVWYPDTVLMYDGNTTPKMAVLLEADGNGSSLRVVSCWMSSGYDGLKLGYDEQTPYWHGHTDDDPAALYLLWRNGSWSNGKPREYHLTTDGTKHSSYLFGCGGWSFSATHLMFTGSMDMGEWVRALNPEWKYRGGSNDDGVYGPVKATGKTIYVMNIKGYRDLLNEISSKKNDLLDNAGIYTPASIRNYVNAVKAITALNPKDYVSTTSNNVTSWGSKMTTAYSNYTAAVNGLTKRTFDLTYENLFSFSDFINSNSKEIDSSCAQGNGCTIEIDNTAGTITAKTGSGEVFTTSNSDAKMYSVPVTAGTEYKLDYDAEYRGGIQTFVFFYDDNGSAIKVPDSNNNFYSDYAGNAITFTVPAGATRVGFRFGTYGSSGNYAKYSNIRLYETSRQDIVDCAEAQGINRVVYNAEQLIEASSVPTITRTGYTFKNWLVKDVDNTHDGNWDLLSDYVVGGSQQYNMKASFVIYSEWTANTYTVTWKFADKDNTIQTETYSYGAIPTAPANTAAYNDAAGHHTFAWDSAIGAVTGDVTYTEKETVGGHAKVTREENRVEATCGKDGSYDLITYCSECDTVIKIEKKTISATGNHSWGEGVQTSAPTCTVDGVKTYTCGICGETKTEAIKATGHTEVAIPAVDATCTTPGKTEGSHCSVCSTVIVAQNVIPKKDHNYTSVITTPATHITEGVKTYTCSSCGSTYTEPVAKLEGHTYTETVTPPTCTAEGYTTYTCACGDTYKGNIVAAKGHSMGTWSQTKAPTCITAGEEKRECANCDYAETQPIAATGVHSYGAYEKFDATTHTAKCNADAACTASIKEAHSISADSKPVKYDDTYHDYECEKCGERGALLNGVFTRGFKEEHTWVEDTSKRENETCTTDGKAYYTCSACEATKQVVIPAAHKLVKGETVAPTCTTEGYTVYTCSVCGEVEHWDKKVALGHDFDTTVTAKDATCTADGNEAYKYCKTCSLYFSPDAEAYAEGGAQTNASYVIGKLGHSYGTTTYNWTQNAETKAWSCTATRACTRTDCDEKETAEATVTSEVTTDPTCEGKGKTTYTAKFAEAWAEVQTQTKEDVAALGHSYGSASYTWTKNEESGEWSCTATRTCGNDTSHVETAEAEITSEVTTPATCEGMGTTTYTATFEGVDWAEAQTKAVVDIAAINHNYGEATYNFAADGSACTATRVCKNDTSHVETAEAKITSNVTTPATCTEKGTTTYTAKFDVDWAKEQTLDVQDIPAIKHDWKATTYSFVEDGSACTATRVCKNDATHVETATATVSSKVTTDPTCEGMGTTTYTATFAETWAVSKTKEVQDIPAINHNWKSEVTKEPGCETEGVMTYTCQNDNSHKYTEKINPLNHIDVDPADGICDRCDAEICTHTNTKETARVEATCTTAGNIEYWTCALCKKNFSDADCKNIVATVVIPAKGHSEEEIPAVPATCTTAGKTAGKKCTVCGEVTVEPQDTALAKHTLTFVPAVSSSCTEDGNIAYWTCSVCNGNFADEEATQKLDSVVDAKDGHTYTSVVTAPTCDLPGYTTHTCSGCGDTKVDTNVDALGHKYEVTDHKDASCTAEGYDVYTCKNDTTHTYTEVLEKLPHTEEILPGKAATCNEEGLTEGKKCSVCGTVTVSQQIIPATGEHKEVSIGDVPPTCVSTGSKGKVVCEICGITISEAESIPKTDHQYGAAPVHVIPATCIKGKVSVYKCKFCDERKEVEDPANEKAPHTIVEVCVVEATCEFSGVYSYYCTTCSETVKSETIPALGHADKNGDELCDNCNGKYVDPDNNKVCGCICHKEGAFMKFIYKIVRFFWKLFKISKSCSCGAVHY